VERGTVDVVNEWPDVGTAVRALPAAGPSFPVIEAVGYVRSVRPSVRSSRRYAIRMWASGLLLNSGGLPPRPLDTVPFGVDGDAPSSRATAPQPLVSPAPCERVSVPDDEQAPGTWQAFELVLAAVDEMEI
jgi:hypothetical protein